MKKIVLVEDDKSIQEVFKVIFSASNYVLVNLNSGEEIMSCQIDAPDLFILDKQISGTNGLDVCRIIKSSDKFKNVPVIMISAHPEIISLAKEAGADDAISKPFSLKTLRSTIQNYI